MTQHLRLRNGLLMPSTGFGTYGLGEKTEASVKTAIETGYRFLETAPIYKNETAIADAIEATIDRDQLFITSKIPPHIKTYDGTLRIVKRILKHLRTDYLDALLINNPVPWGKEGEDFNKENHDVWRALEYLYDNDTVGVIGVSNFTEQDLKNIIDRGRIKPHINQLGIFVGHDLPALRDYCSENDIVIQGHSPLARGRVFKQSVLNETAKSLNVSPSKLAINFVHALGVAPVIRSAKPEHIKENFFKPFPLNEETLAKLHGINHDVRDYLPPGATRQL